MYSSYFFPGNHVLSKNFRYSKASGFFDTLSKEKSDFSMSLFYQKKKYIHLCLITCEKKGVSKFTANKYWLWHHKTLTHRMQAKKVT